MKLQTKQKYTQKIKLKFGNLKRTIKPINF